ncbi:M48 family metalloprotease [Pedomonas mirosovicensis]|uniref:M48 family metalloprotease n=1 Tax=Pedomonas mirosovicensis TaxID=2908641 RepID=UPI002169F99C|nr:M48 family metalloprotease [Pedomonas mirosovicensis]MCH8685790.1 M48 family metalloprotease [Pedomonas mirosovicensis]
MARTKAILAAVTASMLLGSCSTTPAGSLAFTPFMSRSQEQSIGESEHPKLLAEFGGAYPDDKASGYVAMVGGRVLQNSETPGEPFTFTLLDSSVVNAFALPGGYVYISRQLLALMNDEAELASVLGHEIGHVTDRHTAKRYNTQMLGGLGSLLVAVLTGSGQLAQMAGQAAQVYTLSYSRDQELKADSLGIRYISRAGYDPYASPDMLSILDAQDKLDAKITGRNAEEATPNWARTHPLTSDRVAQARQMAQKTGIAPGSRPRNRDALLAAIDGLVVDDSAEQGFVRGRTFAHKQLKLTFTVPEGFTLQNSPRAVMATGPGQVQVMFAGGPLASGQSLGGYLQEVWTELTDNQAGAGPQPQYGQMNGMQTATIATRLSTSSAVLDVSIHAFQWSPSQAYHFVIVSPAYASSQSAAQSIAQTQGALTSMLQSFRKLSDAEAAKYKERRIKVVTVARGQTAQQLAQRMAYDDYKLDRFLVLNGFQNASEVKPGNKVKLIVYGD